jgi:hypothetical protein
MTISIPFMPKSKPVEKVARRKCPKSRAKAQVVNRDDDSGSDHEQ